jgi:hypothetical protein
LVKRDETSSRKERSSLDLLCISREGKKANPTEGIEPRNNSSNESHKSININGMAKLLTKFSTDLSAVVNSDSETNGTGGDVTTNTTDISLSTGVGVVNGTSIGSDGRAGAAKSITDLHTLNGETGILSLNGRDIETRPAVVGSGAKVKLTPGGGVGTRAASGDRGALRGGPATLGIGIESVVLGSTGRKSKSLASVAIEAVHLAILAILVPDNNGPVIGVVARELNYVLVVAGVGLGNLNDVATVGVADVTDVGIAAAGGAGASTEAGGGVAAGRRDGGPRRRSGAAGGGSLATGVTLRKGENTGGESCQQHKRLGEVHFGNDLTGRTVKKKKNDKKIKLLKDSKNV